MGKVQQHVFSEGQVRHFSQTTSGGYGEGGVGPGLGGLGEVFTA